MLQELIMLTFYRHYRMARCIDTPNHKGGSIMSRTVLIMAALLVGGLTHSSPGQANDRSLRALTVPASSCQEDENSPFEDPFKTPDSIGRFTPGFYEILCPLPINNIEMSGTGFDNDISRFRVTYRDTDGVGIGGEISVSLQRAIISPDASSSGPVCATWSSNTNGPDERVSVRDVAPCRHDVRSNSGATQSFYFFVVILERTTAELNFFGIDFP
jgi:hypothetical protein